eukprot:TRINITY_DN8317_c0_g1_i1.p1 TRINITY_DN8317_c0_g1~~TRINITY_DN8317_c0_g1_i1.p1  ORF type:complete len:102 (-),score=13.90 TRINITY_DN8317_c0_g1_i1:753-1058(-)
MDSGDILLGRPWMYDKNDTHGMRDNTYTFMHGGKQVTIHPMKPKTPKKKLRADATKEVLHITMSTEASLSLRLNPSFYLGRNDVERLTKVWGPPKCFRNYF